MAHPTCTERDEIPTYNAEFAPEEDRPCTDRAVARLVIEHDGERCGDDGRCLFDPETGLELSPWTKERLLCAVHLSEHHHANGEMVGATLTEL